MAIMAPRLFKMDVRSGTAGAANGEPEIKTSKISKHFECNILTHISTQNVRNVTLLKIRGLAEIIVPVRVVADIHQIRL